MGAINPEEREGDFVPAAQAQDKGYWGTPVSEFPNERFELNNIVKLNPGGYAGTEEGPQHETMSKEAKDANAGAPKSDGARKSGSDS